MTDDAEMTYEVMLLMDGDAIEFDIERVEIQPERSFSEPALRELSQQMILWVGTRLMRRWDATGEPPTALHVTLTAEAR